MNKKECKKAFLDTIPVMMGYIVLGIGLLVTSASVVTVALTTLFMNARHLFYGLSMLDTYKDKKHKGILVFY